MPAMPQDYPTSYGEAIEKLNGKYSRTLSGTATTLCRRGLCEDGAIAIVYHTTAILTFHPNGSITLDCGGYFTPTTARKMNAGLFGSGVNVYIKDFTLRYRNAWTNKSDTLASPVTIPAKELCRR